MKMNSQIIHDLYELAYNQIDQWDHIGLQSTISQMRSLLHNADTSERLRVELFDTILSARLDDDVSAMQHLMSAKVLASDNTDEFSKAELLLVSARVSLMIDETAQALEELEAAWHILEQTNILRQQIECAITFNIAFRRTAQWDTAASWLAQALQFARLGNLKLKEIHCMSMEAGNLLEQGDAERKQTLFEKAQQKWSLALQKFEALETLVDSPLTPSIEKIMILADHSSVLARLNHRAEAISGLKKSLDALQLNPDIFTEININCQLAVVYLDDDNLDAAAQVCQRGIALSASIHSRTVLGDLLDLAATIAEKQNDFKTANSHLRHLLLLNEELAIETAHKRARVTEVRMETDRALAQAAAEQNRAHEFQKANLILRRRADDFQRDAHQDALTGLANRRCFNTKIAAAHADAVLRNMPLCVAMIDIDHFKKVNDTFGHPIGDLVLCQLAQIMTSLKREKDLLARIGGEEFAVVFSEIGKDRAQMICERIRQAVECADWGQIAPGLTITISIGTSDIAATTDLAAGWSQVDSLLYKAKNAGRNRVETLTIETNQEKFGE